MTTPSRRGLQQLLPGWIRPAGAGVHATNLLPQLPLLPDLVPTRKGLAGIIDIGSNSVRLVVYQGLTRTPAVVFNEKVMAGLGRGLAANGRLSDGSMKLAVTALARFAMLADDMGVESLRTVATAAVREAANADEFIARVRDTCGLDDRGHQRSRRRRAARRSG